MKDKDVIQVFTNGNNDRANPYHRALYPYFNPEAEAQWIAIAGLRQMDKNTDPDNYKLEANFNEAGYAKYWTLSGPGQNGYTATRPATTSMAATAARPWLLRSSPAPLVFWPPVIRT